MILDVPPPPEKVSVLIWASPDHVAADEPLYIHDWDDLLRQARTSLETRRKHYPDWVQRGRLTQQEADDDIQAWSWIAGEWQWIVSDRGEHGAPPPHGSIAARKAAVTLSLQRIDDELRRGNRSHDIYRQAHIAMALAWHLDRIRFGAPMIHMIAESNHARRRDRDAAQPSRSAA